MYVQMTLVWTKNAKKDGWNIVTRYQPPNSPDFNVLDLGFFNSIQSLQYQEAPTSIDEFIKCVFKAFDAVEHDKLNKRFLSYQCALESCMNVGGSNKYKLHHIQKDKNKSNGVKYDNVFCDLVTYSQVITQLEAIEHGRIS